MVWKADYYLVTSFFKTPIVKTRTFLYAPIIRRQLLNLKQQEKNFTLVYQNSDFDYIIDELKKIPREQFILYSARPGTKQEDNIRFKHYPAKEWLNDLKNCRAIIATAGSTLAGEALALKKPYFALPIAHQSEQILNAFSIKKMGIGDWAETVTADQIKKFIARIPHYQKNLKKISTNGNQALFKKLDSLISNTVQKQWK